MVPDTIHPMQKHLLLTICSWERIMSKVLAAHQPNFMPYLGFFDKMKKADIFVIRDEVQFTASDYHHRNRIRINSNDNHNNPQFKWLTVPVEDLRDYILHISIKRDAQIGKLSWQERFLHDIKSNYQGTPHFEEVFSELQKIFDNSDEKVLSLNMKIINFLKKAFDIKTEIIMASELGLKPLTYQKSDASEELVNICKKLNADTYLSGNGARVYLNEEPFKKAGIKVEYQNFHHPVYKQRFPGFIPNLASIDALFCMDKKWN
jgi:hypothetical protein